MSNYTKEGCFLIAEGGSSGNELYIFMEAKKNHPEVPKIIYDGRDHAIFLRNARQKIILDYIHPEIRDKLRKAIRLKWKLSTIFRWIGIRPDWALGKKFFFLKAIMRKKTLATFVILDYQDDVSFGKKDLMPMYIVVLAFVRHIKTYGPIV